MRIISILEACPTVKKILEHLDLWDTRNHDPPDEGNSHIAEIVYDDSDSQIPQYDYWDRVASRTPKKSKSGIDAELRPEKGILSCFPAFLRLSANHFQSIDHLFHSFSDLAFIRPPASGKQLKSTV